MWQSIKQYASRIWKFITSVLKNSLRLFKVEIEQKYRNFKKMNPVTAGQILIEEGACFFLGASKEYVLHSLRTQGSSKSAALVEAFETPYDDSFTGMMLERKHINLWNLGSTLIKQFASQGLHAWRPTPTQRMAFNIDLHRLSSIFS